MNKNNENENKMTPSLVSTASLIISVITLIVILFHSHTEPVDTQAERDAQVERSISDIDQSLAINKVLTWQLHSDERLEKIESILNK